MEEERGRTGEEEEVILQARGNNPRGAGVEGCTLRVKMSKGLPQGF